MWKDFYFNLYNESSDALLAVWPLATEGRSKVDSDGICVGFRYFCGDKGCIAEVTLEGDMWKLHMKVKSVIHLTAMRVR